MHHGRLNCKHVLLIYQVIQSISSFLLEISLTLAMKRTLRPFLDPHLPSAEAFMPCLPFININYYLRTSQVSIKCSTVSTRLGDVSPRKFISQFKCRNKWWSYVPIFQNVVTAGRGSREASEVWWKKGRRWYGISRWRI